MATNTAQGSGNWSSAGNWDQGHKPTTGEPVVIPDGFDITVDETAYCESITIAGGIDFHADVVLDDDVDAFIKIEDSGEFDNNGTDTSPREIRSASASPTYPWKFRIEDLTGYDGRTINMANLNMTGNQPYLGNDDTYLDFNGNGTNSPYCYGILPIARSPVLQENDILGRDQGRVRQISNSAGTVQFTAVFAFAGWDHVTIETLKSSYQRLSFISHKVHLPKCRIERAVPTRERGLYVEYSITLREDA